MRYSKMIVMMKQDVDRYDNIREEAKRRDTQYVANVHSDLIGKYSHLDGFPKIQDGTVWLQAYPNTYLENVIKILGFLKMYLLQNEEKQDDNVHDTKKNLKPDYSKVFIVHGHDGELKQTVARVLDKQGIRPIILSEQANQGNTIIEKLEKNSDVGAAICLFTNDDTGKSNKENNSNPRARQNVVFEAGYCMGRLGRDRVVIIADPDNEIPGDLGGMVYTSSTDWKISLCKDLKSMGYDIDFNKLF
ncbi:nucleotide-binding protein [Ruminococcus sp.]|uniref:nucleotide-binding protein n=1 Tax=Ruminococcus sp. TaxID=41978 RepID=UPI002873DB79|nr:nucleotide-binding protein [Ruminococcus sp.]